MLLRWFVALAVAAVLAAPALPQSGFRVGTGTSVITPFLDEPMAGYYYPRSADGVHDDLRAKALVFEAGGERIVLVACDTVGISREVTDEARAAITKRFNIPAERVLISATHCHTGPVLTEAFRKILARRVSDAVATAMGRMEASSLYAATEQEPSIAHYRRFFMRDGTVRTNPGFLNPDVVKPAGEIDPRVGVLFAENARREPLFTWVNYALHLDTVGGTWISADYPYYLGRLLSSVRGRDMLTVFTIGAAGNLNHWDVRRPGPQRGNETSRTLGETLGAAVIKAYHHMESATPTRVAARSISVPLASRSYTQAELEEAKKIMATPPEPNVDFTLERVKASRIVSTFKRGVKEFRAELQVLAAGPVAFVGIPGELFVELGKGIREKSPFPYTFIVTLANDGLGYIPTREAYDQGAYEPTSSRLAPGSGEILRDKAIEVLKEMRAAAQ